MVRRTPGKDFQNGPFEKPPFVGDDQEALAKLRSEYSNIADAMDISHGNGPAMNQAIISAMESYDKESQAIIRGLVYRCVSATPIDPPDPGVQSEQ